MGRTSSAANGIEQLMEEQAETTAEGKEGRGVWTYVYWAGAVLVLYVLSWGPTFMMFQKGWWNYARLAPLYRPLGWAYDKTPLHKPLGMYLRLWCPNRFDKNGDLN
jgi:hypothetical protein